MKIWTFSDLHLSNRMSLFGAFFPDGIPEADLCVVAGDVINGDIEGAVEWLDRHVGGRMPVICTLGNHEFYNKSRSIQDARAAAQHAAWHTEDRVRVLDDMGVTIDGIRFLGTTLWTDFQLYGDSPEDIAYTMNNQYGVNDFRAIFNAQTAKPWTPGDARRQHLTSLAWLDDELERSEEPVVVISHHAPHRGSLDFEYERDITSAAFVSDLEDVIMRRQPALWLHGHTHTSFDYSVGDTRVVCNPHGYGAENARRFNPGMVIEIDPPAPKPKW